MSCVHRDLKPANLMLGGIPHDSTDLRLGGELGVIKIAGQHLLSMCNCAMSVEH